MAELLILIIGLVASGALAILKTSGIWETLTWFWVLVPFCMSVLLIVGAWCGFDFD